VLQASQILRAAERHDFKAIQRARISATRALDPKGGLKGDKIGGRANVLCGHDMVSSSRERTMNRIQITCLPTLLEMPSGAAG
jgi:hypothetical protein